MATMQKITPFLWFDNQAEEAINYYVSLFEDSEVESIDRYPGGPMEGKVMRAVFRLDGQRLMAMDAGPQYRFTEAISLFVDCESQQEVDRLWGALTEGGEEQPCGWLKDRYGLSWQIIPSQLGACLGHPDPEKAQRATEAMLQMKKIDISALQRIAEAG